MLGRELLDRSHDLLAESAAGEGLEPFLSRRGEEPRVVDPGGFLAAFAASVADPVRGDGEEPRAHRARLGLPRGAVAEGAGERVLGNLEGALLVRESAPRIGVDGPIEDAHELVEGPAVAALGALHEVAFGLGLGHGPRS